MFSMEDTLQYYKAKRTMLWKESLGLSACVLKVLRLSGFLFTHS